MHNAAVKLSNMEAASPYADPDSHRDAVSRVLFIVESEESIRAFDSDEVGFGFITIGHALAAMDDQKPAAVLIWSQELHKHSSDIGMLRIKSKEMAIPFIFYSLQYDVVARKEALKAGFDDYYYGDLPSNFTRKLQAIRKIKEYKNARKERTSVLKFRPGREMLPAKRAMDIVFSLVALILLSPLLLIVALLIKLDSKGPIFYISKRAGNGYRVFDFYKFRSMRQDADKQLQQLAAQNQYGNSAFFKIKDDPRVTRLGSFLRTTSIDELPQLLNVLKGDMSLVGNRPLPLYEAEKLTRDGIAYRFLAPAGITGLWQITKRGKEDMSEEERIRLDMIYARKYSFLYDLKILMGTFPALLQKERV